MFGKLASAPMSLQRRALPLGLAHGAQVLRDVAKGSTVFWDDVEIDETLQESMCAVSWRKSSATTPLNRSDPQSLRGRAWDHLGGGRAGDLLLHRQLPDVVGLTSASFVATDGLHLRGRS